MPATGTDLLATSGGELYVEMFPADTLATLTTNLNIWVAAGLTLYDDDDLARAYGYVQAYSSAIALRATDAASQTLKTGENRQYTDGQLLALERARDRWQGVLDGVVPGAASVTNALGTTRAVSHAVQW